MNDLQNCRRSGCLPSALTDLLSQSRTWGVMIPGVRPRGAFAAIALAVLALASSAFANLTNRWEFENGAQYQVSDPSLIEVAYDADAKTNVARLLLQAALRYDASIPTYYTTGTYRANASIGADVSIIRASPFGNPATFTSRVFDNVGGLWERIHAQFEDKVVENAGGPMTTNYTGMMCLYHFNNSLRDEVRGSNAQAGSAMTFVTSARVGSHAADFVGNLSGNQYVKIPYLYLLNGAREWTISFWMKRRDMSRIGGLVGAYGALHNGVYASRDDTRKIAVYINGIWINSASTMASNSWTHVAATWRSSDGDTRIYLDGKLDRSVVFAKSQVLNQTDYYNVSGTAQGYRQDATFDEVAIFNRALSADEVASLYLLPKAVLFQVRSGGTTNEVAQRGFVGPDGTAGTFYAGRFEPLQSIGSDFRVWEPFAQYRAYLYGPPYATTSKVLLDAAGFLASSGVFMDNTTADFGAGVKDGVATWPTAIVTPQIAMGQQRNGGFRKTATFTSRVVDGGVARTWYKLRWSVPEGLDASDSSMVCLYRMDGGFANEALRGGRNGTAVGGVAVDVLAKFGTAAALFDGVGTYVDVPGLANDEVRTIEFWINTKSIDDGVMQLCDDATNRTGLAIAYGQVVAYGMPTADYRLFVNGNDVSRRLLPGWNHVALVSSTPIPVRGVRIGVAAGDFFRGSLDEAAMYDRVLDRAEAKAHFVAGIRTSAGRVRLQVRSGDSLPLSTTFVGDDGTASDWFEVLQHAGATIHASIYNKRYFQYRVLFEGSGDSSPVIGAVQVDDISSGTLFTDDSVESFSLGDFGSGGVKWVGDELQLIDRASTPGLVNASAPAAGLLNLWHMDESVWGAGSSVADAASGQNGNPQGGAIPTPFYKVGAAAGLFDGSGDYVIAAGTPLLGDLTVSAWVRTTGNARGGVVSKANGGFRLEVNSDGVSDSPGRAAFVMNIGGGDIAASSKLTNLNDGAWHHLAGIRSGQHIHLYVDGWPVASAGLGGTPGVLAQSDTWIGASPGAPIRYLLGTIDEVMLYSRALTGGEILYNVGVGRDNTRNAIYTGRVLNAGGQAIWEDIQWQENFAAGESLSVGDPDLVAMWHFDETNGLTATDAALPADDGTLAGAVSHISSGRFGWALLFGGSARVDVPDSDTLHLATFSVECWAKLSDAGPATFVDKQSGAGGFRLATDANGRPFFWIGGTGSTATAMSGLHTGVWNHIAGTYDGSEIVVYINGMAAARVPVPSSEVDSFGGPLRMGLSLAGGSGVKGILDEVAIHRRALQEQEVADHYSAGIGNIRFQVSVGNDEQLIGSAFIGPDGTANSYFTIPSETMVKKIPLGRYFQYRSVIESESSTVAPVLQGMIVKQSRYPDNRPWIMPADGYGELFLGRLMGFSHRVATNLDSAVRYQLSGDNGATWYYLAGSTWTTAGAAEWGLANSQGTIAGLITEFYNQIYQGTGGVFKFRAFLDSDGSTQTALDWVQLVKSRARLHLTFPNGQERGADALVVGVPYVIRWKSEGPVSDNLRIDLYNQSGSNFVRTIATGIRNSGASTNVIYADFVPARSDDWRIRIFDLNDATIADQSDGDFQIIQTFRITAPDGGEQWYVGYTNRVTWESPGWGSGNNLGTPVVIWFSNDGGDNWFEITNAPNAVGNNVFNWLTPSNRAEFISEQAKMGVSVTDVNAPTRDDAAFYDISDEVFTNAGIVVTYPTLGSGIKMGNLITIRWVAAGAGTNGVSIDFYNGSAWTNLTPNAPCLPGANTFDTILTAQNPTEGARILVRSLHNPSKVWGLSHPFTLADINVISPVGGTARNQWQIGTVKTVQWTSGGAGDSVNIEYSVDGTNWMPIAMGFANINSGSTVVTNEFSPWVIPGPPSDQARVRVIAAEAGREDLYDITELFDLTGVQIVHPNGTARDGVDWEFDLTNVVSWLHEGVNFNFSIEMAYEDNPGTNDFETLVASVAVPKYIGQRTFVPGSIRRPSNFARARVTATQPSDGTELLPVRDVSDAVFKIKGMAITHPSNGVVYTMGTTNFQGLQWFSASAGGTSARVFHSTNGLNNFAVDPFLTGLLNQDDGPGAGNNAVPFVVPRSLTPTDTARLKIAAGIYSAVSAPFTVRGIRLTRPAAGEVWDIGSERFLRWKSAGLNSSARAMGHVSAAGLAGPWQTAGISSNMNVVVESSRWVVEAGLDPSTNAVVRMSVISPSNDIDVVMYSDPFTLKGIKMTAPGAGAVLDLGATAPVTFLAAGMGASARAAIYYSADGGPFDLANPVTNQMAIVDGPNSFLWRLESSSELTRMPSTNARLMVVSGSYSNISPAFTVRGIKVTSPIRTDIWAITDGTNTIRWASVDAGPTYDLSFSLWEWTSVVHTESIAPGVPGILYHWPMTNSAIGSNVTIQITDGRYTAVSERFEIVPKPSIRIINPKAGDFWKVGSNNEIQWSRGGNVDTNFVVAYSTSPFDVTNTIHIGQVDLIGGIFSFTWVDIPNTLGRTRIIVTNINDELVKDTFEDFDIAARFDIESFTADIYALETVGVNWITRGEVTSVDLYYSTDPLRSPDSWTLINTEGAYNKNIGHDRPAETYPWTTPNIKTPIMWLRVQDHAYFGSQFPVDKPGPFDDIGSFAVNYYAITWKVLDSSTSNNLNQLSVTDSSGWSAADLTSPITREYPFGTWDTVWFREFYNDYVVFNWESRPSRTIEIIMNRSQQELGVNQVLADFAFDAYTNRLTIHAWLQRSGRLLTESTRCDVQIYDAAGQTMTNLASTTPLSNEGNSTGVYRFEWDRVTDTLKYGQTYFAKVSIEFSGQTYESIVTYTLRLALDMSQTPEILDAIAASSSGMQSNLQAVASNLSDFAASQAIFRSNALDRLDTLTNATRTLEGGISNLQESVGTFTNRAMEALTSLATNIGVILPAITNLDAKLPSLAESVASARARILTRPTTVTFGSTNTILYKTIAGYASSVTLSVSNAIPGAGAPVWVTTGMREIVGGIYQTDLVADWGTNAYTITCSDPPGVQSRAWDSIVVSVVGPYQAGESAVLGQLVGDVQSMGAQITNLSGMVRGLTNTTAMLQSLDADVAGIQTTLEGFTNLSQVADSLAGINWSAISNLTGFGSSLTNIYSGVTNIQGAVEGLTNLPAILSSLQSVNWGAISNISALSSGMTNILDATTNMQATLAGLTNLSTISDTLAGINWGAMSNLDSMATALTELQTGVTDIRNVVGGMTNLPAVLSSLQAVNWNSLSNIGSIASGVTNIQTTLNGLTNLNAISAQLEAVDWGSLSNLNTMATALATIRTSVTNVEVAVGSMSNLPTVLSSLQSVDWGSISNMGALAGGITNILVATTNMQSTLAGFTNLNTIASTLSGVNWGAMSNLDSIATALAQVQAGITNIQGSVGGMTNLPAVLASLESVSWGSLSNMGSLATGITNIQATLTGFTNLNTIAATLGAVNWGAISNLDSMAATLGDVKSSITNLDAAVSGFTNLPTVLAALQGVNWGSFSNIGTIAVDMTNVLRAVTNIQATVGGMTNLDAVVASLQGVNWGSISNLGGIASAVTNILAAVGDVQIRLAGITNLDALSSSMTSVTNALTGINWSDVTAMRGDVQALAGQMSQVDWNDVYTIQAGLNSVMATLGGVSWGDVGAMQQDLQTLMSGVSAVQTQVGAVEGTLGTLGQLDGKLGSIADGPGAATVFGQLAAIEGAVGTAGASSVDAAKKAQSARTEAQNAAAGIQDVKSALSRGDLQGVGPRLQEVRESMKSVQRVLADLGKSTETGQLFERVRQLATRLEEFSASTGYKWLNGMKEPPTPGGGAEGGVDKAQVEALNGSILEIQGRLLFLQKMIEQMRDVPVVEESLVGGG